MGLTRVEDWQCEGWFTGCGRPVSGMYICIYIYIYIYIIYIYLGVLCLRDLNIRIPESWRH